MKFPFTRNPIYPFLIQLKIYAETDTTDSNEIIVVNHSRILPLSPLTFKIPFFYQTAIPINTNPLNKTLRHENRES